VWGDVIILDPPIDGDGRNAAHGPENVTVFLNELAALLKAFLGPPGGDAEIPVNSEELVNTRVADFQCAV
jgi:hypothetical protein